MQALPGATALSARLFSGCIDKRAARAYLASEMPTYEYLCSACGNAWEEIQKISADALEVCPKCGQSTAKRQISAGNFILKGGGWYADLYSSSGKKSGGSRHSSRRASSSTPSTSTESKPEAKPAAAAPAASPAPSGGGTSGGSGTKT